MFDGRRRKTKNLENTTKWGKILGYMDRLYISLKCFLCFRIGWPKDLSPFISLSNLYVISSQVERGRELFWWELIGFMICRVSISKIETKHGWKNQAFHVIINYCFICFSTCVWISHPFFPCFICPFWYFIGQIFQKAI